MAKTITGYKLKLSTWLSQLVFVFAKIVQKTINPLSRESQLGGFYAVDNLFDLVCGYGIVRIVPTIWQIQPGNLNGGWQLPG